MFLHCHLHRSVIRRRFLACFPPAAQFSSSSAVYLKHKKHAHHNVVHAAAHKFAAESPAEYWARQASAILLVQLFLSQIHWLSFCRSRVWDRALDISKAPFYTFVLIPPGEVRLPDHIRSWFKGALTNVSVNALDRHVAAGRGDQAAFFYDSPVTAR